MTNNDNVGKCGHAKCAGGNLCYEKGKPMSTYEPVPLTEEVSYSELARRVGDCILNNELQSLLTNDGHDFELFNGEDSYCYKHNSKEICTLLDHECDYESYDVYQTYVITAHGAEYLQSVSNEIVYYCKDAGLYLWGITHYGTGWDYVHTTIKAY